MRGITYKAKIYTKDCNTELITATFPSEFTLGKVIKTLQSYLKEDYENAEAFLYINNLEPGINAPLCVQYAVSENDFDMVWVL